MCMFDFRKEAKKETAKNPLWKVQRLLDELNENASNMWIPRKWLSIDEQTLGFQGRSGIKLCISYKKEGDGFQCDAICDEGYTFSFFFRHGDPLPSEFKNKVPDLLPTAQRVVWLAHRLPNFWSRIFMDNLFNSWKLFTALYLTKSLGHGVVRTTGRGLPPSVRQLEEKNVKEAMKLRLRGRTAATMLINSEDCPKLIAASVYDTKPVHMLSTVGDSIYWVTKKRKVWSAVHREIRKIGYLRLNFIDDYNNHMNGADIADQLRNQYRPDHWMRNRKWWWAFFIWGIGVAGVNAFKMYESMYEEEKKERAKARRQSGSRVGMPRKWTHLEFMTELVYDLIFPGNTVVHLSTIGELDD